MKFFALIGLGLMTSVASAADLPRRSPAPAPVAPAISQPFFVGIHTGVRNTDGSWNNNEAAVSVRGGYEISRNVRVEASYDVGENRSHTGTVNGIIQQRFGSVVPYALIGAGYRWNSFKDEPVYSVGGGVRYELNRNFEVDARYRYVTDRNRARDENVVTLGVNYRF